jgi:integrase
MERTQRNALATGHVVRREGKRGAKFYAKYRLPSGEQKMRLLGPEWSGKGRPADGYLTAKQADDALADTLAKARAGELPEQQEAAQPTTAPVTFAQAAREYLRFLDEEKQRDPTTVRDYRIVIDKRLLPEFGPLPVESITADMIDAFKLRVIKEGEVSSRTVVRYLTVLHGIFKRAKRAYGLTENPASAELVGRPQVIYTGEFVTYDREELDLLVNAAATPQDAALYLVAALTGLRQGELFGLRWGDVDFVGGLVHVRRNYTDGTEKVPKGKKVRAVPMTPDVVTMLARLKERGYCTEDDALVFCSVTGAHLDHFNVRRHFYAAIKRAGLRRIRFHDLRHHFGSMAITVLDGYAVQSYMGHAHYSTTQRYLHHQPKREDAAKLHGAFGGQPVTLDAPTERAEA